MLKFKELRKKNSLTQKEFCEKIGISPRSLSNYENGNIDISLKKLQEIADLFDVGIFDLIDVEKKPVATTLNNIATEIINEKMFAELCEKVDFIYNATLKDLAQKQLNGFEGEIEIVDSKKVIKK